MKRLATLIFFFIGVVALIPVAHAETVLRTSEKVSLLKDQTVEGDFYAAAGTVSLSGEIEGDAHIVAGSVTTNGQIGADVTIFGGTVQVHASVTDDVRVVGGEVTIAKHVGGDVVVLGGVLTILSTAQIGGDVFFYGGEGEFNGEILGSVHGMSDTLRIDGPVRGDVDVRTGMLVLGDHANIDGSVQYQSLSELIRSQNAIVVGDIIRNEFPKQANGARELLIPFLIYAFSVLLMLAIFRTHLKPVLVDSITHFTRNGLVGLAGVIFVPGLILLSFVTVIGSLVGIVLLFASVALWVVSILLIAFFAGLLMQHVLHKPYDISLLPTLFGVVVVYGISLVPYIGPIVLFVATMAVFGAFLYAGYKKFS